MAATKLKIRKKDNVMVMSGRDKGKTGEILKVIPADGRVVVAKVNVIAKHRKPRGSEPGGIQHMEAPIAASKVMLLCPKCEKPARIRLERLPDGKLSRACRRCGEVIL